MLYQIKSFCQQYDMLPAGASVMACVSGGADSMCLLYALRELSKPLGFTLCAAHFNHNLRGEESDGDEAFVLEHCERLGVPFYIGSGDVAGEAEKRRRGVEETARDMRYDFFFGIAEEKCIDRIATAHNADDNLETVLMRIARGTGLRGMCGIPPVRGKLIRPLLCLTRSQIESFNKEKGIPHREDSSNAGDDYTRNLLRHRVVPVLREINPAVNVTAMTGLLRQDDEFLTGLAGEFLASQPEGELDAAALSALPRPVASRVVRSFCGRELSAEQVNSILELAASGGPSSRLDLTGLTLRREYGRILPGEAGNITFTPRDIALDSPVIIEGTGFVVHAEKTVFDGGIYNSLTTFPIKWDKIVGKLTVRPRAVGDALRFSSGTRSVKKLLIDKKIPRHMRDALPVIADDNGPIAVYGLGMSVERHAGAGDTAIIIKIEEKM